MKNIFLLIISTAMFFQCIGQTKIQDEDFAKFTNKFIEINKFPSCFKKDFDIKTLKKINREESLKYFSITEEDLKYNDYNYNFDEDIKTDKWVETALYTQGKQTAKKIIALIYGMSKISTYEIDTTVAVLTTFSFSGVVIDKIVICSQYTREDDWKDVVFIKKNILRIFDYKPNLDNYNIKGSTYYIIDEKQAKTVVEINDYQIDENGKINLIKTHPKKYLQEFVSFYRSYHKDSDDPMNEY